LLPSFRAFSLAFLLCLSGLLCVAQLWLALSSSWSAAAVASFSFLGALELRLSLLSASRDPATNKNNFCFASFLSAWC
jgi:hypothetical protein